MRDSREHRAKAQLTMPLERLNCFGPLREEQALRGFGKARRRMPVLIGIDLLGMQHPHFRDRGVGRYVVSLVEALRRHDRVNDYVLFAHEGMPRANFSWEISSIGDSGGDWRIRSVVSTEAIRTQRDLPLDLLLLTLPFSEGALPRSPRRKPRLASIVYDLIPFLFPERYLSDPRRGEHYYQSLQTLRGYDALLAISESTRRDCEQALGLRQGRAINIGCAGRDDFFEPCLDADRDAAGKQALRQLGMTGAFVFHVGGCDARKNMEGLATAFAGLPADIIQAHQLVIACRLGDGWAERLQKAAGPHADRLVLTDEISDETLRTLYQHCRLFAFPSEYEGFGLPILEAMQCGAPVVAGANSSQIEVVGDAGLLVNSADVGQLTAKMREVLGSEGLRADLRRRGLIQASRFRWEEVAKRTIAAFEPSSASRGVVPLSPPRRSAYRSRLPRLAFFSPLPPKSSGISDYSTSLLRELKQHFRIDLYHDAGYVPHLALASTDFKAFDYRMFPARAAATNYRGILYQMGNCSAYHQFVFDTLKHYPGVVTLHDFFLGDYHYGSAFTRNTFAQLEKEIRHSLPEHLWPALFEAGDLRGHVGLFTAALRQHGLFMNDRIFELASRVIVHEQWNVEAARRINPDWPGRMSVVPFGCESHGRLAAAERARVRETYRLPADSFVIGSFGIASPTKLSREGLAAFRRLAERSPHALFVFVGSSVMNLDECIAEFGLGDRVRVLGRVPIEDFAALAGAVDVALNLRRPPTNGETSASLFALLSMGTPTLVTAIDTFAGYPDPVVVKVPWNDDFEAVLAREMLDLAVNSERRESISRAALAYLHDRHDWGRTAALYAEIINRAAEANRPVALVGLRQKAA
jgi:glycosyltransferase involved in cell wall biosynthesis